MNEDKPDGFGAGLLAVATAAFIAGIIVTAACSKTQAVGICVLATLVLPMGYYIGAVMQPTVRKFWAHVDRQPMRIKAAILVSMGGVSAIIIATLINIMRIGGVV